MRLTEKQFSTPPRDDIFDDIKQAAIEVWKVTAKDPQYMAQKIRRVLDMDNRATNYAVIVAMFDMPNQFKLMSYVKLYESVELISKLIN